MFTPHSLKPHCPFGVNTLTQWANVHVLGPRFKDGNLQSTHPALACVFSLDFLSHPTSDSPCDFTKARYYRVR